MTRSRPTMPHRPAHPFDDAFRRSVTTRIAAFRRVAPELPADVPATGLKHAAVTITLVERDGATAFVLTRRAPKLRSHGGQWALPGGRVDAGETAVDAALRELDEELGLRLAPGDVIGLLDDYPTRSGYLITPVVIWDSSGGADLHPNPGEVESVHRIPLAKIARVDAVEFVSIPESPRRVVRLDVGEDDAHHIHAPTAAVLYQFREVIAGRDTRVADLEQPTFAWK